MDFVVSCSVWALFVTLFVFSGLEDTIYLALGGLASLGVLVSIITAWVFGQLVDRHKGGVLLTLGVFANTITHLFRPFISTPASVMGISIANETATSAYTLPFTRVVFDVADSSGFRITYIMFSEMMLAAGAALCCLLLALFLQFFDDKTAMAALFIFAAFYELIMLLSRRAAR